MRNAFAKGAVVIAATASLGLMGASAASASVHPHAKSNATNACGSACDNFYNYELYDSDILNAYIPGMTGVAGNGGQVINMRYGSNTDPNEDFILEDLPGTVSTYCQSNTNPNGPLASDSVACTEYGASTAYELDFSPYGNDSGYCVGTKGTPSSSVRLQARLMKCGSTEGTILIQDTNNGIGDAYPYISGATSTFSHPDVLTLDAGTSSPDNQIFIEQENLQGQGGTGPTVVRPGYNSPTAAAYSQLFYYYTGSY